MSFDKGIRAWREIRWRLRAQPLVRRRVLVDSMQIIGSGITNKILRNISVEYSFYRNLFLEFLI
jgi:hypothetical protein